MTDLVFVIDSGEYPVPEIDTFDMAERRLLFEQAGIVQEDFSRQEDESVEDRDVRVRKLMRHPGFMETLMTVAYQRGHPELKNGKVTEVINRTNYQEALAKWAAEETAADDPPALG